MNAKASFSLSATTERTNDVMDGLPSVDVSITPRRLKTSLEEDVESSVMAGDANASRHRQTIRVSISATEMHTQKT